MKRNILREDWKPVSFSPQQLPSRWETGDEKLISGIESRRSNGRTSIPFPRTVCPPQSLFEYS
jgi:hypothetical protein